jgi:hypothetical protein
LSFQATDDALTEGGSGSRMRNDQAPRAGVQQNLLWKVEGDAFDRSVAVAPAQR